MTVQTVDNSNALKICHDIIARENHDGSIVLIKTDNSDIFYKIDGVAKDVWKKMKEGEGLSAIAKNLSNKYDVTVERINSDIGIFIADLKKFKIIE